MLLSPKGRERDAALTGLGKSAPSDPLGRVRPCADVSNLTVLINETCSWPGKEPLHLAGRRSLASGRTVAAHPKNTGMKPTTVEFYTKMLPVSHNIP